MTDESPGWDAITAALTRLYGPVKPRHYGTVIKYALGGPDPIDGVSVFPRTAPVPHWHYVGYGMSELYEPPAEETGEDRESGWGFEFTFRLAHDPRDGADPPVWPVSLMQNLARYVFGSGNRFAAGHFINANGPIAADRHDSALRALTFAEDPELGAIDTPAGRVTFLQIVGLTLDEYRACESWRAEKVLGLLAPHAPLLVTDLDRRSVLDDPAAAEAVRAGIAADGATTDVLFTPNVGWGAGPDGVELRMGALQTTSVRETLYGRIPHGRDLTLRGEDAIVVFRPGEWAVDTSTPGVLTLDVPPGALDDLVAALVPSTGRRAVPALPGLTVEIMPTVMRDGHGEPTGEVIG